MPSSPENSTGPEAVDTAQPHPPRVLLITQFLVAGGLERMVHLLSSSLSREFACRVFLYAFDLGDHPEARQRLATKGITAFYHQKGRGFCLRTLFRIARLIRREKIEILHTHETAPLMYATLARLLSLSWRTRIIHTQHSFIHLDTRSFIRHYDRTFQRAAAFVTAVSDQVRAKYLELGVRPSRVRVIPNGMEFPEKLASDAEKTALRGQVVQTLGRELKDRPDGARDTTTIKRSQAFKLLAANEDRDVHWLISMARIHPRKGQDHLIKVWGALGNDLRKRSVLIFAGPETFDGELDRLVTLAAQGPDADRIAFIGATAEPVRWLSASDLFLSGSEYEGMPLAPLEACGAGLPALISDIEGHRLIREHVELFSLDDPADGAARLTALLEARNSQPGQFDPRLRERALRIQAQYSIRKMASDYLTLYTSALNGQRS